MLNFAFAEALELQKNYAQIHLLYEKLLKRLQEELEEVETRVNNEEAAGSVPPITPTPPIGLQYGENGHDIPSGGGNPLTKYFSFTSGKSDGGPKKSKELSHRRQEYGLVYIMYIRFALRAEGVDASRTAFAKARKDKWTTWEVFEAAGKKVAKKQSHVVR